MKPRIEQSVIRLPIYRRYQSRNTLSCAFSTSQSYGNNIPPESPDFIYVPQPLQPRAIPKRSVKGYLPPPRELFPQGAPDRTSDDYLAKTIPEPKSASQSEDTGGTVTWSPAEPKGSAPDPTTPVAWRSRLAASRRKNLRDALFQLKERKVSTNETRMAKSKASQEAREAALRAPERDDERLTSPTILQTIQMQQVGPIPDPNRAERIAGKKANVEDHQRKQKEARVEALHTLYMNARNFIIEDGQLGDLIEREFAPKQNLDKHDKGNIWDQGPPDTLASLLGVGVKPRGKSSALGAGSRMKYIMERRMKQIMAELTGGKMD